MCQGSCQQKCGERAKQAGVNIKEIVAGGQKPCELFGMATIEAIAAKHEASSSSTQPVVTALAYVSA